MNKTVIRIEEESHGTIALAADYKSAVHFLIKELWIDGETRVSLGWGKFAPIYEVYGENWHSLFMNEWDIDQFNEVFDGWLYLYLEEVYDMNEGDQE
jgi:hypothetical protein